MPEYTQEQIDQMLAEAKKGLFTEDELTRRVTAEVDRRVESGIQKGLETQKSKWAQELEEKAKLTAEELARKELEEAQKAVRAEKDAISRRANELAAKELLAEAGVPKDKYAKMLSVLVSSDEEVTKANVQGFIDVFNSTKTEIETQVKSQFTKVPPPSSGASGDAVTKEVFDKMTYSQKMKFKTEKPDLYRQFIQ